MDKAKKMRKTWGVFAKDIWGNYGLVKKFDTRLQAVKWIKEHRFQYLYWQDLIVRRIKRR